MLLQCTMHVIVHAYAHTHTLVCTAHQMTKDFRPDHTEKLYTFDDVQGIEEAKAEVQEIVEFLKFPERFQRLGAKLPTGTACLLLLCGCTGNLHTCTCMCVHYMPEAVLFAIFMYSIL